jgi:MFS family permease
MRSLLRHRDARLFLLGQTVSMFGDRALYLALGIWVKQLTGSNAAAGMVFFLLVVPTLVAPLAGLVVDRVRRRPLMIAADVIVAGAVLALVFVHGRDDIWIIYAVTLIYGLSAVLFGSAQSALLTVMLPEDLLADANGLLQTGSEAMRLIAPLVGAGLFAALGGGAVAVIDALTFLVSAVCLLRLRVKEPRPEPHEHHFLRQAWAGAAHIGHTRALRRMVAATAVCLLVVGFSETLIFAVVGSGLHRDPSFLGVLLSVQGVGAIAGGLSAGRLVRRFGDVWACGLGMALFALGVAPWTLARLAPVVGGFLLCGAGISLVVVGFMTAIQRRTPADLQGRVYSAADMLVGTPQTVSIALGALLSTVVDYRLLIVVMVAVTLVCGAFLLATPAEVRASAPALEPEPVQA